FDPHAVASSEVRSSAQRQPFTRLWYPMSRTVSVLVLVIAASVACGRGSSTSTSPLPPPPPVPVATTTYLALQGGAGHPLLRGQTRRFTPDQSPFWAGVDCYENHIELRVGALPDRWTIDLGAPRGQRLTVGTYMNATRYPFNLFGDGPGISVAGEGRGCDDVGTFAVTDARYLPSGAIERFRAT